MTKETYNKSVDILLDAYNNEKLFHGQCDACAVGNLLHGTYEWGAQFRTEGTRQTTGMISEGLVKSCGIPYHYWCTMYSQVPEDIKLKIDIELEKLYAKYGYTKKELMAIEYVFESTIDKAEWMPEKEKQYKGLSAVLKVMETMVEEEVETGIGRLQVIAHDKYGVTV